MLDPVQAWQLSVLINPSIQAGPPLPPFQLGIVFRVRLLEQAVLKQPEMWQLLGERLIPREVSLEALESWLALDDSNDHAAMPDIQAFLFFGPCLASCNYPTSFACKPWEKPSALLAHGNAGNKTPNLGLATPRVIQAVPSGAVRLDVGGAKRAKRWSRQILELGSP